MNKVIEKIFKGFKVDNVEIPVEFLVYKGKSNKLYRLLWFSYIFKRKL